MRRRPFHAERTSPAARYFISNLRAHRNLGASHALTHLSAVRSMRLLRASSSQTTPMPKTWCKRPTAARSRRFRPAAIESISAMCSAGAEATTVPLAGRLAYVLINRRDLGQLASRGRLIARPAAAEADYRGIRPPKRCPRLGRIQGGVGCSRFTTTGNVLKHRQGHQHAGLRRPGAATRFRLLRAWQRCWNMLVIHGWPMGTMLVRPACQMRST